MIPLVRIEALKKQIEKSGTYIRSAEIKKEIKNIFENDWILNSKNLLEEKGKRVYQDLNEAFEKFYRFAKKDYFKKSEILVIIKNLESRVDALRIEALKEGLSFKEDFQEIILDGLKKRNAIEATKYLKKAQISIKKDPEMSCDNSRKAIEEVFRLIRSKYERAEVQRGTLSQHTIWLEGKGYLSQVERQFFNSGEYSLLSEKGNHANKEKKEESDAIFGYRLVLISIEYLINKGLF